MLQKKRLMDTNWITIRRGGGCKFHIFYFIALLKEKDDERKLLQRIV